MVLGWVTPWEVLVLHSFLRPERPKPLPSTSEAMVLGLGICRDRYAVSLVGLGESFPEWGRNSDSEFVRESPDGFGARLPCPVRGRPRGHRRDPTMAIPRSFERFRGAQWAPVVDAPSATCTKARDDAHKMSALIPALKHRIPSELRS